MKTIYKQPSVLSPLQIMRSKAFDVQDKRHPASREMTKSVGTINLTATIEEDTQTANLFKDHIPGFIAFICFLKKGNDILSVGRGNAVLNRMNKYVERTVRSAFNASLIDAVVRSTKTLDALYLDATDKKDSEIPLDQLYNKSEVNEYAPEPASEKQISYLTSLISTNVTDGDERERFESEMASLSKDQASEMIAGFKSGSY
ncbi:MAG: hypothetical protein NUV47_03435 [Patescibacteria group bacterium]|nr:hypothetical protein [Patescibacteria group bacterium]